MSSEIPQSEEFARENQFRVELPDIQELYWALAYPHKVRPEESMRAIKIGSSHSEDELFSQINVHAMMEINAPLEGYYISAEFNYQNPKYPYWAKNQVEQLQRLLTEKYKYNSVNHEIEENYHSLIIRDSDEGMLYVLNLGAEDEKTPYKWQVESANQTLRNTNNPRFQLIKPEAGQQAFFHLVNNPRPTPMHSNIHIKPIDADSTSIDPKDLFGFTTHPLTSLFKSDYGLEEDCSFIKNTQKWAKFIEDAVNAMSKAKGIPQSGKLTLLPPQDVPQT